MFAKKCGPHPTYIEQLEREEKSAILNSMSRAAAVLSVFLSKLFRDADKVCGTHEIMSVKCYELIESITSQEPKIIYNIPRELDKL